MASVASPGVLLTGHCDVGRHEGMAGVVCAGEYGTPKYRAKCVCACHAAPKVAPIPRVSVLGWGCGR